MLRLLIHILRLARPSAQPFSPPDSIVLCELTRMGDILATLPLVRLLQQQYPAATIHFVCDARYTGVLNALAIDLIPHGVPGVATLAGILNAGRVTRSIHADLALSASPSRRNAFAALASRARCVAGYLGTSSSVTPFLYRYPVEVFGAPLVRPIEYHGQNICERGLAIASALGIESSGNMPERVRLRHATGRNPDRPYVAIHPYASWKFRNWSIERYREIASLLAGKGLDVVFVYGPDDPDPLQKKGNLSGVRSIRTVQLSQLAEVIGNAALFVGSDSGPLHLAAAVGIPHVGLFGPADPLATSPNRSWGRYLYHKVECSPCRQQRCVRPENPCMMTLSVDEVMSAITTQLQEHAVPASNG